VWCALVACAPNPRADTQVCPYGESTCKLFLLQLPPTEFQFRAKRLLKYIRDVGAHGRAPLHGVVLFDNFHVTYFTGFAFIPTERPICFAMNADGERVLFVPRLEVEHAKAKRKSSAVESYIEYPDNPHPMKTVRGKF